MSDLGISVWEQSVLKLYSENMSDLGISVWEQSVLKLYFDREAQRILVKLWRFVWF